MKKRKVRRHAASKSRAGKRKPPRGFRSWGSYMASIRPGAKKVRRAAASSNREGPMKRKRRRSRKRSHRTAVARRRSNPPAARRRRSSKRGKRRGFRRNPPMMRGLIGTLIEGAKGGALVVGGKAVSRIVPALIGIQPVGPLGLVVQTGVGGLAFVLLDKVAGRGISMPFLYGVFANAIESLARSANLPVLSPGLGDETELYSLAGYSPEQLSGYAPGAGQTQMGDSLVMM